MNMTNPERPQHAWFALANTERCRLLRCSLTKQGTHHVDEYETIQNTLPQQEHTRPMTNAGMKHNIEDNERRFGNEIIAWMQKRVVQYEINRLVILAPPRMLGVLRMVPLGLLKGHVEEFKGHLMRLDPGELAEHPMVHELIRAAGKP